MPPSAQPSRAPRRDGIANRQRILDAATDYFAEHGIDASLHGLAAALDLGIGTLYRHFPTRDDLVVAIYESMGEGVDESIDRAQALGTAWDTLVAFVDIGTELTFRFPGGGAILRRVSQIEPTRIHGQRWEQPMIDVVARAHADGSLRLDATPTDVAYISQLLGTLATMAEPARSILLARQRALLLDGLRGESNPREPLPVTPLTVEELRTLAQRGGR